MKIHVIPKKKWRYDEYWYECKESDDWSSCKDDYMWNPSTCDAEGNKSCKIILVILRMYILIRIFGF